MLWLAVGVSHHRVSAGVVVALTGRGDAIVGDLLGAGIAGGSPLATVLGSRVGR